MQAWREAARSRPEWMRSTAKPRCFELGDLIFHQGDQRADDQRGAAARDAGQLIAERLAGAGGHHQQDVVAFDARPGRRLPDWGGTTGSRRRCAAVPSSDASPDCAAGVRGRLGRRRGCGLRRSRLLTAGGCGRADLADHLAHVIFDAFQEGSSCAVAALDALAGTPPTGRSSPGSSLRGARPRSGGCPCPSLPGSCRCARCSSRLSSTSMMAARVAGVPRPVSLIARRVLSRRASCPRSPWR